MKGVTSMGWREGYCKKLSGVLLHGTRGVGSTHWVPRCIVKSSVLLHGTGFLFPSQAPSGKTSCAVYYSLSFFGLYTFLDEIPEVENGKVMGVAIWPRRLLLF